MATLNPIHQSGSASSLTRLADTGCFLCSDGDIEKDEGLVNSVDLVSCKCSFVVHKSCWVFFLSKEGPKVCPSCEKVPIAANLIVAVMDPLGNPQETSERVVQSGLQGWALWTVVGCIVAVIVFVVGMVLASRRG